MAINLNKSYLSDLIIDLTIILSGTFLIALSIYGWFFSPNKDPDHTGIANIIAIIIGLLLCLAPFQKRLKKRSNTSNQSETKTDKSNGNNLIEKIPLRSTL